ncbi:MAG: hypothetical protein P1P86_14775 [Bacteroidales bacterium]|nr:hypothetical protein [Bacteroidales bacterium]
MSYELPIVWHLDTKSIKEVRLSPPDRLTRIRDIMKELQEGRKQLDPTLKEITAICNETTHPTDPEESNSQQD